MLKLIVAITLLVVPGAIGAELTGKWVSTTRNSAGEVTNIYLTLHREGPVVSGNRLLR